MGVDDKAAGLAMEERSEMCLFLDRDGVFMFFCCQLFTLFGVLLVRGEKRMCFYCMQI